MMSTCFIYHFGFIANFITTKYYEDCDRSIRTCLLVGSLESFRVVETKEIGYKHTYESRTTEKKTTLMLRQYCVCGKSVGTTVPGSVGRPN